MAKIDLKIKFVLASIVVLLFFLLVTNKTDDSTRYGQSLPSDIGNGKSAQITMETPVPELPKKVFHDVPFTSQAPLGNWEDVRENNGCEEASLLMAVYWAKNMELTPETAQQEIRKISDFHLKTEGHFHDLSNADTFALLQNYFKLEKAELIENIGINDVRKALAKNKVVIVPVNGIKIGNPHYQLPGPPNHKIVIVGYDDEKQEFVTHDPGTSQGKNYRYGYEKLENSLEDYPTGYQEKFEEIITSMITVEK